MRRIRQGPGLELISSREYTILPDKNREGGTSGGHSVDKLFITIFGAVFGTIGLVFLTVALFSARSDYAFRKGAVSTTGTVVDLERSGGNDNTYKPVFEFVDRNDRKHRGVGSVASSPPAFHRGEEVRVLYNPSDPEGARLDSFLENWFLPVLFGGMGTLFAGVAAGCGLIAWRRRQTRSRLIGSGIRVQARVNSIDRVFGFRRNGIRPWVIVAQWQHPETRNVYLFRSSPIWFDPQPFMRNQSVEVLVNMADPRQYHVDLEFLPKSGA